MDSSNNVIDSISLLNYGIMNDRIRYQLSPTELHQITLGKGQGEEVSSGALAVNTGEFIIENQDCFTNTIKLQCLLSSLMVKQVML